MYGDKNTIKDKLPSWWRHGDPLYYCEEDDTLWLSPKDRDLHWHSLRIRRVCDLVAEAEKKMEHLLAQMSVCKSKTYPQIQKDIDALNARLRKLMASRDWRETNTSHAAKKREVVEIEHRRYQALDELHKWQKEYANMKKGYKDAAREAAELKETIDKYKAEMERARARWETT